MSQKDDKSDGENDPDTFNPGADDDDEPYYEVEKIVSMHVKENGVRMFEIKWKNYPDRCDNTWEPEEHLSCETLLKEYLAANNYAQAQYINGVPVKKNNNNNKKKRKATAQEVVVAAESSQAGRRKEETRLQEEARERRKRELEDHERELEALNAAEEILEAAEKRKKKKSKGKKKAQEDEINLDEEMQLEAQELIELNNHIKKGLVIKEHTVVDKKGQKRKEEQEQQRRKEQEQECIRNAEQRRKEQEEKERQETLEKQQHTTRKMKELREKNEADRREREERQKEADRKEREERQRRMEQIYQRATSTNTVTQTTAIPTTSSTSSQSSVDSGNELASSHRPTPKASIRGIFEKANPAASTAAAESASSSSFGKIKRNNNQNVAPLVQPLDLQNLVSKVSQSKYPHINARPKLSISTNHASNGTSLQSPYFPSSAATASDFDSLPQSTINHSIQSPLLQHQHQQPPIQSPQPNGTTIIPSTASPPIHHQLLPSNTPSPSPPHSVSNGSTPMEWQVLMDPRRQRSIETTTAIAAGYYAPDQQQQANSVTTTTSSQLEGLGMKRQTSRDPRMRLENVKKRKLYNATAVPTPFSIQSKLYNGSKFIATIKLEGKQNCYHESKIRDQIVVVGKNQVRIMFTLPIKALNTILYERPVSYMSISPLDHFVDLSKHKSFYQVNDMAGVAHYSQESHTMVILAEADLQKLTNLTPDILRASGSITSQVCALFIDELIPRPLSLSKEIDYEVFDPSTDNTTPFTWNRVAEYLKFPDELNKLRTSAEFNIYGTSDTFEMLKRANYYLKATQSKTTSYAMMFDRYNDEVFKKDLYKHKRNASTQIWEFGVPDFSYSEMIPAAQVFPNNTGGYITTDMENIVHNTNIIDDIAHQISKMNQIPTVYGKWKFVLPHDWIRHLKLLIKDVESGERVKLALIAIAIALSNDTIEILKIWSTETEEMNHFQFMDRVAHAQYKTCQYFVYVDDISSTSPYKQSKNYSVDFTQSHKIFSDYS